MSVTMSKADGVTVLTLTSDPQSRCPPLCQILKGFCYSPVCCSVSEHLRRVQGTSQSVLGALHIMIGLLNIGLGLVLYSSPSSSRAMFCLGFPFWLGAAFIVFGVMSILSEKLPSPCLIIINVILNLAGTAFAITAIGLYSFNVEEIWSGRSRLYWWGGQGCDDNDYYYRSRYNTPRPTSPQEEFMKKKCLESTALAMMLLKSINVVLIVLSVMEICVTISSVVMGIKALCNKEKRDNKSNDDLERSKTLLEEVSSIPTA